MEGSADTTVLYCKCCGHICDSSSVSVDRSVKGRSSLECTVVRCGRCPTCLSPRTDSLSPNVQVIYSARRLSWLEDYLGLDYLELHEVLKAKHKWYKYMWYTIVTLLSIFSLSVMYRLIYEYSCQPTTTHLTTIQVARLKLPDITVCPSTSMAINIKILAQQMNISEIENNHVVVNYAKYMIAGSGFQMESNISNWNASHLLNMKFIYDNQRGNHSTREYFYKFYDSFGLQCNELFKFCKLGSLVFNCCEIFEITYTTSHGRCFTTSKPLYQTNVGDHGKLVLVINKPITISDVFQDQLQVYIGSTAPSLNPYPGYSLYLKKYMRMRMAASFYNLMPGTSHCSKKPENNSRSTCRQMKWIERNVINRYNCTYPYLDGKLKSCPPSLILKHYLETVYAQYNITDGCELPCKRWTYRVTIDRAPKPPYDPMLKENIYDFRVDLLYNELLYDEFTQVKTRSIYSLLSQIGGQASMFLGISLLTITQMVVMVLMVLFRVISHEKRGETRNEETKPTV